jgi:hypothetical protein
MTAKSINISANMAIMPAIPNPAIELTLQDVNKKGMDIIIYFMWQIEFIQWY